MKNDKKVIVCFLFSSSLLFSCSLFNNGLQNRTVPEITDLNGDNGAGYSRVESTTFSMNDVYDTNNMKCLSSIGDSSILIVPVETKDSPKWNETMLKNLDLAFFGNSEDTGWESVSSFYKKSSYGKLNISGEIAPTLKLDYTTSSLADAYIEKDGEKSPYLIAIDSFMKNQEYDSLRKEFDKNKDGYIDSVAFIYTNEIDSENGYWAVTSWLNSNANFSLPNVNAFMWASYNFISGNQKHNRVYPYAAYGNLVDSHTIIHETGHLLGLDDYYCYDENGWDPSGAIEMHSNNVGDESIYSKFQLGWVNPLYVKTDTSVTLTLRTSSKYPDAILINDFWNNSSCDEYLLIEYYSPDILNNKDAIDPYPGNGFRMYTTSGFRIYHIDARIVELTPRGTMVDYSDKIENGKSYFVGASNSASLSYLKNNKDDFKLLHLMEAGGVNTFKRKKSSASNKTLFKKNDMFEPSKEFFYNKDKFNSGEDVGYKIFINDSSDFQGTLTIQKI